MRRFFSARGLLAAVNRQQDRFDKRKIGGFHHPCLFCQSPEIGIPLHGVLDDHSSPDKVRLLVIREIGNYLFFHKNGMSEVTKESVHQTYFIHYRCPTSI